MKLRTLSASLVALAFLSCTNEGYETGDNGNSYVTGDFVLLHINSSKVAVSATFDDGAEAQMANPFSPGWSVKADTVYRAFLYYGAAKDDAAAATVPVVVKARAVAQVPVMGAVPAAGAAQLKDDPVGFESVWLSKNGKFVNVSLLLKSGSTELDKRHAITLASEGVTVDAEGRQHAAFRLYHDQNGVPQYYTVQQYASFSTQGIDADVVDLHINTYEGAVVKSVALR